MPITLRWACLARRASQKYRSHDCFYWLLADWKPRFKPRPTTRGLGEPSPQPSILQVCPLCSTLKKAAWILPKCLSPVGSKMKDRRFKMGLTNFSWNTFLKVSFECSFLKRRSLEGRRLNGMHEPERKGYTIMSVSWTNTLQYFSQRSFLKTYRWWGQEGCCLHIAIFWKLPSTWKNTK